MNKTTLEKIAAFCILMENNEGILQKAPSYIEEKFAAVMDENTSIEDYLSKLDPYNLSKFNEWEKRWIR